jgi:hypothetical protein
MTVDPRYSVASRMSAGSEHTDFTDPASLSMHRQFQTPTFAATMVMENSLSTRIFSNTLYGE